MEFDKIPHWFIRNCLTIYQLKGVEIKYAIYHYVEQSDNKAQAFYELEEIVNLHYSRIRDIYYAVKKE